MTQAGTHLFWWALVRRDLRLVRRRPADALLPLGFFVLAVALFPLGVGSDATTLQRIAPGILSVCALLAAMLSVAAMYASDHADGSLEQMLLSGRSLAALATAKALAHWCTTGLLLVLATPLVSLMLGMPFRAIAILACGLLLATPVLSLLGGLGAALTLGLRNAGLLIFVIVLPLCAPVLIFVAGAVAMWEAALSPLGHLSLLLAFLLFALAGVPFATAAALRMSA
jgi:heme exporter protein B